MNSVIIGNLFKKYNSPIDPKQNFLQLPYATVRLNQVLPEQRKKPYYTKKLPKNPLVVTKKYTFSLSLKHSQSAIWRSILISRNLVPDLLFLVIE